MDKRFIIIHKSEIVRNGLWAILREAFHFEFILLGSVNEVANYSGFTNTELYIFLQESFADAASQTLITKLLNKSNQIHFVVLAQTESLADSNAIHINEPSKEIIQKIKKLTERRELAPNSMAELSDRERDVLVQVALGLANKEIADKLFISIHTVISHRKHITDKLGIKSISGLTVYAILNKLIDTENIDLSSLI